MCPPESVNRCDTPAAFSVSAIRSPPCRGPVIGRSPWSVLYPSGSMPIFHRGKGEAPPANGSSHADAPARAEGSDWRSFDSVGETYARVMAPNFSKIATDLVGLLGVSPGQRVLDVGTGTGVAARAAKAALGEGSVVVGIDPAFGMLRMAAAAGGGPSF